MIKLYLAEDQSMLNGALTQILNLEDDLEVVGSATDGKSAWEEIAKLKPDVAILDIEMPEETGLDVADKINESVLQTRVIILTTFAQKAYFEHAIKAQVSGYLLKDSPTDDLVSTIRQVMEGKTVFDPELVVNMVNATDNPLTDQEMNVLRAVSEGGKTQELAQKLFLSEGTVRNYLSSIFSKLGVHNRLEAVNLAKKNKWL
ncbi:response regulator transcription factor [Lentilactobacillus sp. Marseille-Q4993]|uniref:response regulator transcription factor n=1 Tax=Lentilactobacillus sp. Marseille-Q4993 TaxID=3039492 RepID=UPI0024BD3A7A|nr:response regulator transcription factor [Lentilactobacillus sp. Marseille-Q4993]